MGLERASRRRWHVHRDDGWEAMMWSRSGRGRGGSGRGPRKLNKRAIVERPEGEGREVRW